MLVFDVQFRQTDQKLSVQFQAHGKAFDAAFSSFQQVTLKPDVEFYEGQYDVTPKVDAQSLPTKDRYLTEDVRIHEIPYFDVGNTSGGSTVYIGSREDMVAKKAK